MTDLRCCGQCGWVGETMECDTVIAEVDQSPFSPFGEDDGGQDLVCPECQSPDLSEHW